MVIELIGTPGAGKSTLAPTIINFFQEHDKRAYTMVEAARPFTQRTFWGRMVNQLTPAPLRRQALWQVFLFYCFWHRLLFTIRHRSLVRQVKRFQESRPKGVDIRRKKFLHWFYFLTGYYDFFARHIKKNEVLVYDEGFVHRVVQFFASELEKPDISQVHSYLDAVPKPDLTLYIQASLQVCKQRALTRGLYGYNEADRESIHLFLANAELVIQNAVEYMRSKGWQVITIDNDTDQVAPAELDLLRQLTISYSDKNIEKG